MSEYSLFTRELHLNQADVQDLRDALVVAEVYATPQCVVIAEKIRHVLGDPK